MYILVDVKVSLPCQLVPPKTNLLNALECEPAVGDASGDGDEVCIVMPSAERGNWVYFVLIGDC